MLCPAAAVRTNCLLYCVCELTFSFSSDPYPITHKNMHRWKLQLSQHMFRKSLNRDREDHSVPGINQGKDLSSLGLMPAPWQDFIFQPLVPANRTWPLVLMIRKKKKKKERESTSFELKSIVLQIIFITDSWKCQQQFYPKCDFAQLGVL